MNVRTGKRPPLPGEAVVLGVDGINELIDYLRREGFTTLGPVARDGAIMPGPISLVSDLPKGVHDVQSPGSYRLEHTDDENLFAWAVGPGSWKATFFPPQEEVWRARRVDDSITFEEPNRAAEWLALIGVRPCEMAALNVLDNVLMNGAIRDTAYAARRNASFVVAVECGRPASTCFCSSIGTGPDIDADFDIALTELDDAGGHRFLARVGSARGAAALSQLNRVAVTEKDFQARSIIRSDAITHMGQGVPAEEVAELLARNLDHPRWTEVAERCLSCANCTLVCPTCFCSDVRDTTDLDGVVHRRRSWASCFDLDHSFLHGGPVRRSASSRYRQWMTHKFSTWWDQFDSSGCVGCGRCVTWCPVGIDITEEVRAIAASDGAGRVAPVVVKESA